MLYGTEVLHVSVDTMDFLDLQQRKLGKVLLSVPMSSANEGVETELGLRPLSERIAERKLKFVAKLESTDPGSELTKEMYSEMKNSGLSQLLRDCDVLRAQFPVGKDIKGDMKKLGTSKIASRSTGKAQFVRGDDTEFNKSLETVKLYFA